MRAPTASSSPDPTPGPDLCEVRGNEVGPHLPVGGFVDWTLSNIDYPPPETVRLGFQDQPLNVYMGEVKITAHATPDDKISEAAVLPLRLKTQACDDRVCLRPEELILELPAAGARK